MRSTPLPLVLVGGFASIVISCSGELISRAPPEDPETDADASSSFDGGVSEDPDDAGRPNDASLIDADDASPHVDAAYDGDQGDPAEAADGDVEQEPLEPPILCYDGESDLFTTINTEACDCAECADLSSVSFTLGARSRVLRVTTYTRAGGAEFGYSIIASDGTAVTTGTMVLDGCHSDIAYCFYSAETNETLDAGAYVLTVDWPHICSNPTSGGQGFLTVAGCTGT
jgi:hypothetical protein